MGLPAYIATDLVRTATLTAAGEQDAINYPVANAQNGILAKGTRLQSGGGNIDALMVNSPYIQFDSVFLGGHSLPTASAISIYGGVTTPSGGSLFAGTSRDRNMWMNISTQTVNDIIEVQLTQAGSSDPVDVGELVIGPRVLFPRAAKWGVGKDQINTGVTNETRGGVLYDYEFSKYKIFRPTFRVPESEYQAFLDFSDAVGRRPFVWIPDVSTSEAWYVRKQRGMATRFVAPGTDGSALAHWYDIAFEFRTESEGLSISV